MIKALYCNIKEFKKTYPELSELIHLIPTVFHKQVYKHKTSDYQYSYIAGLLLIREIFKYFQYKPEDIEKITRTKHNKPVIDDHLSFNISNSGNLVICAGSLDCMVGVDIERIRPVNINHFKKVFSPEEFRMINNNSNSGMKLFEMWTIKESIIKADGRGFAINMKEINAGNNTGTIKHSGVEWHLKQITQFKEYTGHICSNKPVVMYDSRIPKLYPGKKVIKK